MSRHTPGPWVAKDANDGCGDVGIVSMGHGVIAECFNEIRQPSEGAVDECKANARLIALAPELHEFVADVSMARFTKKEASIKAVELLARLNP